MINFRIIIAVCVAVITLSLGFAAAIPPVAVLILAVVRSSAIVACVFAIRAWSAKAETGFGNFR